MQQIDDIPNLTSKHSKNTDGVDPELKQFIF